MYFGATNSNSGTIFAVLYTTPKLVGPFPPTNEPALGWKLLFKLMTPYFHRAQHASAADYTSKQCLFFSKKSKQFSKLFRFLKILSARSKIFSKMFCRNHKKIEGIFNKRTKNVEIFAPAAG